MINYYKVGGCVRDEILGVKNKDIDYAVEAESYEAMRDDLLAKGSIIWQERPEFFAIRGKHPIYGPVDFTLCRKEGFYSDSRHPDSVEVGTIYDDLARRDFTVNAIALEAHDDWHNPNQYIDPHNGIIDINDMILRCVGNPEDRFSEDPLRILRAIRFHIVRGFKLHDSIDHYMKFYTNSYEDALRRIPLERIYEELRKCYEYDTWGTMKFFQDHHFLERLIFNDMGLKLAPVIGGKE